MSWYGNYNQSVRKLDDLLDTRPTLSSLITYPDFIQHLKSFNPKLLDYMTNSPIIPQQIVTYISVSPIDSDSMDRKYKLPLLTVQMVQTDTMCIMNSLLKQNQQGQNYFLSLFNMLKQPQILPLLAGYFSRVNQAMCRVKYRQVLQLLFTSSQYLQLLIQHSQIQVIANLLPQYLCVQISKNIPCDHHMGIKIPIIKSILHKIQTQKQKSDQKSKRLVSNLSLVIRDIIQKYYLIANGKQLIEFIFQEKHVIIFFQMASQQSENSFTALNILLSFLKYYSLSALNAEQASEDLTRRNMELLQNQPFIKTVCFEFNTLLTKVKKQKTISLYGFTLLQVLCHCITLSSFRILTVIKQSQLFPTLIDLLYRNQTCNILHKLIQRTFLHIFTKQKSIYQKYKQYLFCQISIIDLTMKRLLDLFPQIDSLKKAKNKAYFGILIKIINIYSSVAPNNQLIRQAINAKAETWNTMKNKIIIPYQSICKQQMGTLQNIPQKPPIQYTVKKTANQFMPRLIQNAQVIQQIKKQQQTMPKTLQLNDIKKQPQTLSENIQNKIQDDSFFNNPLQDNITNKKSNDIENTPSTNNLPTIQTTNQLTQPSSLKKPNASWTQYLSKRKVQVGQQIKMQRSLSSQRRLSADKHTRLTSPSPSKKRKKWNDDSEIQPQSKKQKQKEKEKEKQQPKQTRRIALTKDLPKIPISTKAPVPHPLTKSSVQQTKKSQQDENKRILSLSMANMQSLRKTTVQRLKEIPSQKKFRKIQDRDLPLFVYLGLRS